MLHLSLTPCSARTPTGSRVKTVLSSWASSGSLWRACTTASLACPVAMATGHSHRTTPSPRLLSRTFLHSHKMWVCGACYCQEVYWVMVTLYDKCIIHVAGVRTLGVLAIGTQCDLFQKLETMPLWGSCPHPLLEVFTVHSSPPWYIQLVSISKLLVVRGLYSRSLLVMNIAGTQVQWNLW